MGVTDGGPIIKDQARCSMDYNKASRFFRLEDWENSRAWIALHIVLSMRKTSPHCDPGESLKREKSRNKCARPGCGFYSGTIPEQTPGRAR